VRQQEIRLGCQRRLESVAGIRAKPEIGLHGIVEKCHRQLTASGSGIAARIVDEHRFLLVLPADAHVLLCASE
jgi:hypothetical protein